MPRATHYAALIVLLAWHGRVWARMQVLAQRPASDMAAKIAEITTVLFVGGAVIFALMVVLVGVALWGPARLRQRFLARRALIVGAGIAFPVITLTLLLAYTLAATTASTAGSLQADRPAQLRVQITGELWWWRVRYFDTSGAGASEAPLFETANEIRIPAGVPVELVLVSDNVIHSFWVPELNGKLDLVPGHINRIQIEAREPGVFQGQCAEYCGAQHAKMRFTVHAVAQQEFDQWVEHQQQPARPADPPLHAAAQRFEQACARCHTVRGTSADGVTGPDLTHVGSRASLAGGTLPNNVGALAGWISASQQLKPGNPMPSFDHWSGADLRAVATYLDSLK